MSHRQSSVYSCLGFACLWRWRRAWEAVGITAGGEPEASVSGQSWQLERRTSRKVGRERTNLAWDSKKLKSEPRLEHSTGVPTDQSPRGLAIMMPGTQLLQGRLLLLHFSFYGCTVGLVGFNSQTRNRTHGPQQWTPNHWTTRSFLPHFCFPYLTHPNPGSGREGNSEKCSCSLAELTVQNHHALWKLFCICCEFIFKASF